MASEEEERENPGEEKKKSYWLLSLGLILLLLSGGGYYALTGMRQEAHKLAGGSEYDQLSANSSVYNGQAGAPGNKDYFQMDGDSSALAEADKAGVDRINSSLKSGKEDLVSSASGSNRAQGAAGAEREEPSGAGNPAAAGAGRSGMAQKLRGSPALSRGPGAGKGPGAAAGSAASFQGNGAVVGKASAQRETLAGTPKKAGRSSVMESLKGAFKATFYGARLSSQDSARGWIARSFDGTEEAATAIQYEEKMRSKLDKVNPDSIPDFLRDQDVNAAEAKRLTVSDVAKPRMDKDGTKDALDEDKDYQAKKLANEFSGSMINGLFAGVSGTGSPDSGGGGANTAGEGPGMSGLGLEDSGGFADPEDVQSIVDTELQDWVQTNGFGGECGCTAEAPCCCMPQDSVSQNCPVYGPFLPNDPCGAGMYDGGGIDIGDAITAGP